MGKSCFKFRKVVDCFKYARDALYYPTTTPICSYLQEFIFPDEILRNREKEYKK